PSGEWMEELTEKPQHVSVHVLSSTTALMSWTSSQENYNGTIVSVVSLTCQKQKESQRLEKQYCTQVNSSKPIIENLVPGAQYQVVMYLRKGPLIGPPSDPVTFAIVPTGIKDLMLYPLGPTALVLSWTRPYLGVFRKYVVEMFYFNPATMTSEWTTYYEIAATTSLTASVRIANLLPAWYYNFRVTMVTWGDPELSCCDSSTISFITAPVAPEITSVEYFNSLLYISWTYGDDTTDLSHSRMLHWMVVAEGKKKIKKSLAEIVVTINFTYECYDLSVFFRMSNIFKKTIDRIKPKIKRSNKRLDIFSFDKRKREITLIKVEITCQGYFNSLKKNPILHDKVLSSILGTTGHLLFFPSSLHLNSKNVAITSFQHFMIFLDLLIHKNSLVCIATVASTSNQSQLLVFINLSETPDKQDKKRNRNEKCWTLTLATSSSLHLLSINAHRRRSIFAFLTLLPSCLWTDYLLAFYINPWSKNGLKKRKLTKQSPVQLDDFDAYIRDMAKDSDYKFSLQFEELKLIGLDIPHFAADLPLNRCKNRYTNILPYDFSRVRLISMNEEEGADYINANYIPGYNSSQEYIATQGPLPETRNDFWKMVLQQKSQIIVMLTQCNEKRRVKCDHYWPFTEEPITYGDITVEMISEEEQDDWACRHFRIIYVSHEAQGQM
uniref:Protein tyrosine phosphatase receptor type O n=1 Tax=Myotis lucifugus TaxID=59463 RepID=G1Q279_MYOLU